jgi:hypothetical protein
LTEHGNGQDQLAKYPDDEPNGVAI